MPSVTFIRRINPDGSQTSFCEECENVVTTAANEIVLEAAENLHICNLSKLSDSMLPGYLTLAERVMLFLDVHLQFGA
jgi:hypothetical protein